MNWAFFFLLYVSLSLSFTLFYSHTPSLTLLFASTKFFKFFHPGVVVESPNLSGAIEAKQSFRLSRCELVAVMETYRN